MSDTDDLLEVLQADITAILKNVPALSYACILADNEGDIESRVEVSLATATETEGKTGLSIVVLRPDVKSTEQNLPGPPLTIETQIQVLENVLYNRDEETGTLKRTSQAALRVLNALQHQVLGDKMLYAPERDAIREGKVKAGYVSHVVTVLVKSTGISGPGKCAAVTADEVAAAAVLTPDLSFSTSGLGAEETCPPLVEAGTENGKTRYRNSDYTDGFTPEGWQTSWNGMEWETTYVQSGFEFYRAMAAQDVATPDLATFSPPLLGTGTPNFVLTPAGEAIELTCATDEAAIYYTLDGSYPAPTNAEATLYTAPFAMPAVGTLVRAAAYKSTLNPGNVLGFRITE